MAEESGKVEVLFKAVGDAPIMKQSKWKVDGNKSIAEMTLFLRNYIKLVSRAISFGINMYLLRKIDGDVLGLVNVSLMLFYTTTIFLVREPFRKAFLSSDGDLPTIANHAWLAPVVCPFIAAALYLCFWLPFTTPPSNDLAPSYPLILGSFAFAAWLESIAEPYVILSLRLALDAEYAFAQGLLVVLQRLFVVVLMSTTSLLPVHIFCVGQVLSSFSYLIVCIYFLHLEVKRSKPHDDLYAFSLFPTIPRTLSKEDLSVLGIFVVHSFFKQILTDGTNYVLTFTSYFSLSDQAVFDAVDKLGGLVARVIFAPLEHSAYIYFSACLKRTVSASSQNELDSKKAIDALSSLLHTVVVIGLVIFVFALSYSPVAIKIYGGSLLSSHSGAGILRAYCLYIIVIAVNGVTECFAMATMNKNELLLHGWFLFCSSAFHILFASIFPYFIGAYGLIIANIINMLLRIAYSWHHIQQFLPQQINILEAFPSLSTIVSLLFCLVITSVSSLIFGGVDGIMHSAAHLAVGGSLFIFVANHIYQNDIYVAKFLKEHIDHLHGE